LPNARSIVLPGVPNIAAAFGLANQAIPRHARDGWSDLMHSAQIEAVSADRPASFGAIRRRQRLSRMKREWLDTVLAVKGFPRLRAREAVLDAICGSRLRRPFHSR